MVLTTDKARVSLYLDNEVKQWLEETAKEQNRSMSNYVEWVLNELKKKGVVKVEKEWEFSSRIKKAGKPPWPVGETPTNQEGFHQAHWNKYFITSIVAQSFQLTPL